jgi:hypothetical protein
MPPQKTQDEMLAILLDRADKVMDYVKKNEKSFGSAMILPLGRPRPRVPENTEKPEIFSPLCARDL